MSYTVDLTQLLYKSLTVLYPKHTIGKMTCVEIGSFEGKGSILIQSLLCSNAESKLYCIDPFDDEYVKGDAKMAFWDFACKGQKHRFYSNTATYPKIVPLQGTSDDMIRQLENDSVDFVYIDGDHSPEQVYKDACNMFPKMKKDGIMLFDDYMFTTNGIITKHGIDKFLNEYDGKYTKLINDYQLAIQLI